MEVQLSRARKRAGAEQKRNRRKRQADLFGRDEDKQDHVPVADKEMKRLFQSECS